MAELAALSLACNILQLMEVGVKICVAAQEQYNSRVGLTEYDKGVIADSQTLGNLIRQVQQDRTRHGINGDPDFRRIAQECETEAESLIQTVKEMGVRGNHNRAWESLKSASKRALKTSDIQKKISRLQDLRQQLTLHLIAASRCGVTPCAVYPILMQIRCVAEMTSP